MRDLPGPGLKPLSPALAGGFSTTAPPGKPPPPFFKVSAVGFSLAWLCVHSVFKLSYTEAQERVCLKSALYTVNAQERAGHIVGALLHVR